MEGVPAATPLLCPSLQDRPLRLPVGVGSVQRIVVSYANVGNGQLSISVTWELAGDGASFRRPGLRHRTVRTLCVSNSRPTGAIKKIRTVGSNYLASRSGVVIFFVFFFGLNQ